jgi:CheY-like chemotaxis protein
LFVQFPCELYAEAKWAKRLNCTAAQPTQGLFWFMLPYMVRICERQIESGSEKPQPGRSKQKGEFRSCRLVVADNHEDMLHTIVSTLGSGFLIVGMAKDGRGVLELALKLSPDVLLIDICMPIMNGIEAVRRLKSLGCEVKVVFLTIHDDPDFLEAAMSAGASGYVLKSNVRTDLVPAIRMAMKGVLFISQSANLNEIVAQHRF